MARDIRVLVWGLGRMGSGIVRALAARTGVAVVGAVCSRPEKEGVDLGELVGLGAPLGAVAMRDGNFATQLAKPDVAVAAHAGTVADCIPAIEISLAYQADVVAIGEEMAYPWRAAPDLAMSIHDMATRSGKSVIGTGINPGFVSDTLIVALTACCQSVERVTARRLVDIGAWGERYQATRGVGLSEEEFEARLTTGEIAGHGGSGESISMIADALGWRLTEIREEIRPVIAQVKREAGGVVVEGGMVAGARHRAWGAVGSRVVIELDQTGQIDPAAESIATHDAIQIAGEPPIDLRIEPEIAGGPATVALACNAIPLAMRAQPGLLAMTDLPVPRGSVSDMRHLLRRSFQRGSLREVRVPGKNGGPDEDGGPGEDPED